MRGGGKEYALTRKATGKILRVRMPCHARFESSPAHQRESANMIHAMKKRGISDKGRASPVDIRTCESSP